MADIIPKTTNRSLDFIDDVVHKLNAHAVREELIA